jgi:metallo-beta-lactamase family protein
MRLHFTWLAAILLAPYFASADITVSVHGAAEQVSGSLTQLDVDGLTFFIDAGLDYGDAGGEAPATVANRTWPIAPSRLDGVLLTHAHLDHSGRIPHLIRSGFNGPIWTSHGTAQLLPQMLRMVVEYEDEPRAWVWSRKSVRKGAGRRFVKAHWHPGCSWKNRINEDNRVSRSGSRSFVENEKSLSLDACEVCLDLELKRYLQHVKPVRYGERIVLGAGLTAHLRDAGHIPGSASIVVEHARTQKTLVFTGDIGGHLSPMTSGPFPLEQGDAVWIESTYGADSDAQAGEDYKAFPVRVAESLRSGKIVWIPAFALDRTQKVLYEIGRARAVGLIGSNVPIICSSPSARAINELYRNESYRGSVVQPWFRPGIYRTGAAIPNCNAGDVPKAGPAVILSSGGMMDNGSSEGLMSRLLPRDDVTVMIVGYAGKATPARQLVDGARVIQWHGKRIPVSASVVNQKGFSGHSRFDDTVTYLSKLPKNTRITLVHGEKTRLPELRLQLMKKGFTNVHIAKKGAPVRLD